jgi:hypothetical protein
MAGPETLRETTNFGAEASGEALRREVNCELRKDHLFSGRSLDLSTAVDSRKESPGVEPRRFLAAAAGVMIRSLSMLKGCPITQYLSPLFYSRPDTSNSNLAWDFRFLPTQFQAKFGMPKPAARTGV